MDPSFWNGRRVFVTGHTGFKGSWLSLALGELGAEVAGYALEPEGAPNLYSLLKLRGSVTETLADIGDLNALTKAVRDFRPHIVLHLAAQALVSRSHREPLETLRVNAVGTGTLLEACRQADGIEAIVVVTTDKVYQNPESGKPFAETDPLGGDDPYSASKACAEIVVQSFRKCFFDRPPRIATARAGNVIGGGDWSSERLVPDAVRAFSNSQSLILRNPEFVRPWQHVLDPLKGYLMLAERLVKEGEAFAQGWNFGPSTRDAVSVRAFAEAFAHAWGNGMEIRTEGTPPAFHESRLLQLDCGKARSALGWIPDTDLERGIRLTVDWYKTFLRKPDQIAGFTRRQIRDTWKLQGHALKKAG